jgi:hypothetical protein
MEDRDACKENAEHLELADPTQVSLAELLFCARWGDCVRDIELYKALSVREWYESPFSQRRYNVA